MKPFTQRWREASDEAEDQPMEDTPTDPKEAQVIIGTATQHVNELSAALAEQTERADRWQGEVEAARREASTLATSIWRSEYQNSAPNWSLCDSVAGIISQIDNMYAGVRGQRDQLKMEVDGLRVLTEAEKATRMKVELAHETDTGLLTAELAQVQADRDRLQAEVEESRKSVEAMRTCGISGIESEREKEITRLTAELDALKEQLDPLAYDTEFRRLILRAEKAEAELDAVRKERDAEKAAQFTIIDSRLNWPEIPPCELLGDNRIRVSWKTLAEVLQKHKNEAYDQRDAAQARCAELEAMLSETDDAISGLFWTSDDGDLVRGGEPEDAEAPLWFIEKWKKLRALLTPAPPEEKRP